VLILVALSWLQAASQSRCSCAFSDHAGNRQRV
jgi:hypothetical protein